MLRIGTLCAVAALACLAHTAVALPPTAAFTYQGELNDGGAPANGLYDFRFRLFDAPNGGAALTLHSTHPGVTVDDGLFTVAEVEFPGLEITIATEQAWIEVEVRPAGAGAYTVLTGRQALTATPIASALRGVPVQLFGLGNGASLETYSDQSRVLVLGTSNADGGQYLIGNARSGIRTIEIDADADDMDNGVSQAQIRLSSAGTGAFGGNFIAANNDTVETIDLLGGGSGFGGSITVRNSFGVNNVQAQTNSRGGMLSTSAEDGFPQIRLEPDIDGTGAFLSASRSDLGSAFILNGNMAGSENPLMQVIGSSVFTVDTRNTGDSAVSMSNDAVSSTERNNEPGVASFGEGVLGFGIDTQISPLASRTINCPTDGYVLVMGTAQISAHHNVGVVSSVTVGVSQLPTSLPPNQDVGLSIPGSLPTGSYSMPVSVHGLFQVAAGPNTFHFNASANGSVTSGFDVQLTTVFFPTAYGTIDPTLGGLEGAAPEDLVQILPEPGPDDLAAERADSIEADRARILRENAELRERLDRLEASWADERLRQDQSAPPGATPIQGDPREGTHETSTANSRS